MERWRCEVAGRHFVVKPASPAEYDELMSAADYEEFTRGLDE